MRRPPPRSQQDAKEKGRAAAGEVVVGRVPRTRLPQQLEPFAEGSTLAALPAGRLGSMATANGGGGAASDGVHAWLAALGHLTVELLLQAVLRVGTLSTMGARQLAADASYVNNILSGGLGLPHDERITELAALLTAPSASFAEVRASSRSLTSELVQAIAVKRGLQL